MLVGRKEGKKATFPLSGAAIIITESLRCFLAFYDTFPGQIKPFPSTGGGATGIVCFEVLLPRIPPKMPWKKKKFAQLLQCLHANSRSLFIIIIIYPIMRKYRDLSLPSDGLTTLLGPTTAETETSVHDLPFLYRMKAGK